MNIGTGPVGFRINEGNHSFQKVNLGPSWATMTNSEARGICWLFEPPLNSATYVVGVDVAQGISNWDRAMVMDDEKTDNSAVEVWRLGVREEIIVDDSGQEKKIRVPTDYQVAEYAAPVDYEACAAVVNALGRLYRGRGSMGVAHTIIEVYPGPGWMTEKTLISKYGYLNFYTPKYINTLMPTTAGKGIGWTANYKNLQDLWILGTRHLNNRGAVLRSPWLLDEMKTTKPLSFTTHESEAESGKHDDRLRATMLAFWAAHDFSAQVKVEMETTVEKGAKAPSWQASDMSSDRLSDEWNKRFRDIANLP